MKAKLIEEGIYKGISINIHGTIIKSPANNILKIHEKNRLCVKCNINGKKKTFAINRIVATAFVENTKKERTLVIHKDGNTKNNYYKNLEWATRYEFYQNNIANGKYKLKEFEFKSK